MPELPDITVYLERLDTYVSGKTLNKIRLVSPFVLRTVEPAIDEISGQRVKGLRRLGKRIVFEMDGDRYIVIHLMIAGRLRWRKPNAKLARGNNLAAFDFDTGTLVFTEASKKRRASFHLVQGEVGLAEFDRGGLEILESTLSEFTGALSRENHTLKRALTDQRILSGIGNAYSDEILHRARLSPFKQTQSLNHDEFKRLYDATQETLSHWIERLRAETGDGFPEKVTAFHGEMAVHGRYRQPCLVCGSPIQRIVYAENESNYCAKCQTGGKLLADRALSRLLKSNWPRSLEELENAP